ncbi:UNVERIFIED_CONTAM: UV damage repair protein UvrX [Halobacillus marinus]|uniref:Y-family DNA polymerase n=1 Tax=Bacillaceae TaxID=186817 RepID=UPI0002A4EB52|nr:MULTISPECIES: UV-damage repair protein UvrX [Bacillaceae]ELK44897.1 UV-damage repair protein UvrX [Halobacillus sp. BAB-2008]QHT47071.1 UV damage repair protein UvrX [Bacillus sp. SB49]
MKNPNIDYGSYPDRGILCVDMKSFYASCAAVARGLDPLICPLAVVADMERRGSVVLAATPAMKEKYGIRTGSRLFEIPSVPEIVIVSAQMKTYLEISTQVTDLFHKFVPKEKIHTYSVDESFLEVGNGEGRFSNPEETAQMIIDELKETFHLDAAIGIGPNMLLAKLCLDLEAKKKGVARWTYDNFREKLWPVAPLSEMWGIGPRLERRLNRMGIWSVGQLAKFPLEQLEKAFGVMGNQFFYHANGVDLSDPGAPIIQGQVSYGKSQILLRDYHKPEDVKYVILEMCEEVARRARRKGHAGRTISLGIGYSKTEGGSGFHRSVSVEHPTSITMDLYRACLVLFSRYYNGGVVRKISISLGNITEDSDIQLDLFQHARDRKRDLGYVMDEIRERYGQDMLLRAVSWTDAGTARHRSRLVGGHYAE